MNPCGYVCDLGRAGYTTKCRFWANGPEIKIHWYKVPPDRPVLPVASFVANSSWYETNGMRGGMQTGDFASLGEAADMRPFSKAGPSLLSVYTGHFCGTDEQWAGNTDFENPHDHGDPGCCTPGMDAIGVEVDAQILERAGLEQAGELAATGGVEPAGVTVDQGGEEQGGQTADGGGLEKGGPTVTQGGPEMGGPAAVGGGIEGAGQAAVTGRLEAAGRAEEADMPFSGCRLLIATGDVDMTTATLYTLTWRKDIGPVYDTDNYFNPAVPDKAVIPFDGYYLVQAAVGWYEQGTLSGTRSISLFTAGSVYDGVDLRNASITATTNAVSSVVKLNAGDEVLVKAYALFTSGTVKLRGFSYVETFLTITRMPAAASGSLAGTPAGAMLDFAGTDPPPGWLLCDGTAYAVGDYPALFAAIGHTWDTFRGQADPGDGFFRVPNWKGLTTVGAGIAEVNPTTSDRTIADSGGEETHLLTADELATHHHTLDTLSIDNASDSGGMPYTGNAPTANWFLAGQEPDTPVGENTGDVFGDVPHNTMQPFGVATRIIKT